jgi:hypothetical protein
MYLMEFTTYPNAFNIQQLLCSINRKKYRSKTCNLTIWQYNNKLRAEISINSLRLININHVSDLLCVCHCFIIMNH